MTSTLNVLVANDNNVTLIKQTNRSSRRQISMTNISQNIEQLEDMLKQSSRKRKRSNSCEDGDTRRPAKRPRMMIILPKTFLRKCREWHERRRKVALGVMLYLDEQMRATRRMARKRASFEMFVEYEGISKPKYIKMLEAGLSPQQPSLSAAKIASDLAAVEKLKSNVTNEVTAPAPKRARLIKRLSDNSDTSESSEVKVTPIQRRSGWRRKCDKRF